jgi:hypothetical protein
MPGIGLVIEGAVQQAPQWSRQFMDSREQAPGMRPAAGKYNAPALPLDSNAWRALRC